MEQGTHKHTERRISLISGLILLGLTLAAGLSVFVIMQRHTETLLSRGLSMVLDNRVRRLADRVEERRLAAFTIATRPFLSAQIALSAGTQPDPGALRAVATVLDTFLPLGFSGVAAFNDRGKLLAQSGEFVIHPALSVPLSSPYDARLLWDGHGMVLQDRVPVGYGERVVGYILAESRLTEISRMFQDMDGVGKTAEMVLCGPAGADMQCFPGVLSRRIYTRISRTKNGRPLPMSFALDGKTGEAVTKDYRGQSVIAAYQPVADLGLGMVLKVDASELFEPVEDQIRVVLALLAALLVVGGLLLRWQIAPLVRQVIRSEQDTRRAVARISDSEARTRAILQSVDDGIVTADSQGCIESFNPAAERIFGYKAEEVLGKSVSLLMPEPYCRQHDGYMRRYLESGERHALGTVREVVGLRRDGSIFPLEIRLSEIQTGDERLFIGAMTDIAVRKEQERHILHLANHDALTDLPNRNLLYDRMAQAIAQAHREKKRVGVLFLDLDNFKTINDSLGHDVGDELLIAVGKRIEKCLREGDTVARQGGDEFIVVMPNLSDLAEAKAVALKLLGEVNGLYHVGGDELHTSASIGIAIYPEDGTDVETLMKHSDIAMYRAKEGGRNGFQFFTREMNRIAAERHALETDLRRALEKGEFVLHYQPQVDMASGAIMGVEALIRWQHPTRGLVMPGKFIPLAESIGLIELIGRWVLKEACAQSDRWGRSGATSPRVAVNVSARQFRGGKLLGAVREALSDSGLAPERLELEITESVLMEYADEAVTLLKHLSDLGVQLAIDDFGVGYSSLGYLKRFPIDKLKIDRSFVADVPGDGDDAVIVTTIIGMAHSLGVSVVAEGVETEAQLSFLREQGCDQYQGYHFSPPRPPEDIRPLLASHGEGAAN